MSIKKNNKALFFMTANGSYIVPAIATINHLIAQKKKNIEYLLITSKSDFTDYNKKKLNDRCIVKFIDDKYIDLKKTDQDFAHVTSIAFARAFISHYCELKAYTHLFYCDPDILVNLLPSEKDLSRFQNSDKAIALVDHEMDGFLFENYGVKIQTYFNTGFIIYNTDKFSNLKDRFIGEPSRKYKFWDQCMINIALNDNIYPLPKIYNNFIDRRMGNIHWTGPRKPWIFPNTLSKLKFCRRILMHYSITQGSYFIIQQSFKYLTK